MNINNIFENVRITEARKDLAGRRILDSEWNTITLGEYSSYHGAYKVEEVVDIDGEIIDNPTALLTPADLINCELMHL